MGFSGRPQLRLADECSCDLKKRIQKIVSVGGKDDIHNVTDALTCRSGKIYIQLNDAKLDCSHEHPPEARQSKLGLILAIVLTILVVLAISSVLFWFWMKQRARRQQVDEQRKRKVWRRVDPDVRLYKETELQVEIEYATPMEECFDDDSPAQKHPLD